MNQKRRTNKLTVLLLVLTLLTTCFIGGSFAKYITKGTDADSARVAKWGVTVVTDSTDAFAASYTKDDSSANITQTYSVNGAEKVVAPGTKSTTPITFSIKGEPETAVNVAVTLDKDNALSMITREDYHPIKWTLKQTREDAQQETLVEAGNLEAVEAALAGLSKDYDANTNLGEVFGEFSLSWEWLFYADDATDIKDTAIGNVMAGTVSDTAVTSTQEAFQLDIMVTQIN